MSKYADLLTVARDPAPLDTEAEPSRPLPTSRNGAASKKRGRPAGKRTDPNYVQASIYIRKQTHEAVKIELIREGRGREFSELAETLLAGWLRQRAAKDKSAV
jgi:hypothetical protein